MEVFFEGRRRVAAGVIQYKNGKAELTYEIYHRWENILTSSARCGATETFRVTRTIGISREQKQAVQTALTGTIGLDAIGKLEGRLATESSITIQWNAEERTDHEFEFTAPRCGRYTAVRYQLIREYDLKYDEIGWLLHRFWTLSFAERLERYHDGSQTEEYDSSCGCPEPRRPIAHGIFEAIGEKVSFWTLFSLGDDVLNLLLPGSRITVRAELLDVLLLQLPTSLICPGPAVPSVGGARNGELRNHAFGRDRFCKTISPV